MARPMTAKTLREVVGERKPRTNVLRHEARSSPLRCASPASPSAAGALPPLPHFMREPALIEDSCSTARSSPRNFYSARGEDSDSTAMSGRSTVLMSMASTPAGSRVQSPRHWCGHGAAASDTDSCRDDDSVSSMSSISTCSERSATGAVARSRMARPHTATVRSSAVAQHLARSLSTLSLGSGQQLEVGERMAEEFEAIFSKARHGRYKEVEELLEAGALVDGTDARGNSVLIAACQGGSLKTVKALLRRGCETNAQNHQGNTALHYAFAYKYEEVADYLIRKGGALPDICNMHGLACVEGLGSKLALERSSAAGSCSLNSTGDAAGEATPQSTQ